jgi:hypothetical protein
VDDYGTEVAVSAISKEPTGVANFPAILSASKFPSFVSAVPAVRVAGLTAATARVGLALILGPKAKWLWSPSSNDSMMLNPAAANVA